MKKKLVRGWESLSDKTQWAKILYRVMGSNSVSHPGITFLCCFELKGDNHSLEMKWLSLRKAARRQQNTDRTKDSWKFTTFRFKGNDPKKKKKPLYFLDLNLKKENRNKDLWRCSWQFYCSPRTCRLEVRSPGHPEPPPSRCPRCNHFWMSVSVNSLFCKRSPGTVLLSTVNVTVQPQCELLALTYFISSEP